MTYQKAKEEIVESSPQKTDAGKEELYLYSLRKMAEENVENNRTGLTNLHNINSFFYLCLPSRRRASRFCIWGGKVWSRRRIKNKGA